MDHRGTRGWPLDDNDSFPALNASLTVQCNYSFFFFPHWLHFPVKKAEKVKCKMRNNNRVSWFFWRQKRKVQCHSKSIQKVPTWDENQFVPCSTCPKAKQAKPTHPTCHAAALSESTEPIKWIGFCLSRSIKICYRMDVNTIIRVELGFSCPLGLTKEI